MLGFLVDDFKVFEKQVGPLGSGLVEQLVLVIFDWFSFFAFFDEIQKYVFERLFDLAALGHLLDVLHGDILESLRVERGKDLLAHVPVLFGLL